MTFRSSSFRNICRGLLLCTLGIFPALAQKTITFDILNGEIGPASRDGVLSIDDAKTQPYQDGVVMPTDGEGDTGSKKKWQDRWVISTDHETSRGERCQIKFMAKGNDETFPHMVRVFEGAPLNWENFTKLIITIRITSPTDAVMHKVIKPVFHDAKTLIDTLPGQPMQQQSPGSITLPVGESQTYEIDISKIKRSQIRKFELYIYKNPPNVDHEWTVELERMELSGADPKATVFDGFVYGSSKLTASAGPQAHSLATSNGTLGLSIDKGGRIVGIKAGTEVLGLAAGAPSGLLLKDLAKDTLPFPVSAPLRPENGGLLQEQELSEEGLALQARYTASEGHLSVTCTVRNLAAGPRGLVLYFALPMPPPGPETSWWRSLSEKQNVADFVNRTPNTEFVNNSYPVSVLSPGGRSAVALAIPMDEPSVYRIVYNPQQNCYFLAFEFGLAGKNETSHTSASFTVRLYSTDPSWGLRAAMSEYYRLFPALFAKRVKMEGGWFTWGTMQDVKDHSKLGVTFSWGPSREGIQFANSVGKYSCLYIEPEFDQLTMGDFKSHTFKDAFSRLTKLAAGDTAEIAAFAELYYIKGYKQYVEESKLTGLPIGNFIQRYAQATLNSLMTDEKGEYLHEVSAHPWIGDSWQTTKFPCNLNPRIPDGRGQFIKDQLKLKAKAEAAAGGEPNGLGLDCYLGYGQTDRKNFNAAQFGYSEVPLSYDVKSGKLFQWAAFGTMEWLKDMSLTYLQPNNKVVIINAGPFETHWNLFSMPFIDIIGVEHTWVAQPELARALAFRKPVTILLKTDIKSQLLHCVFPGLNRYDSSPETRQNEEDMEKYNPYFQLLAKAGWQILTLARTDNDKVYLERYGEGTELYLVVQNSMPEETTVSIAVDTKSLDLPHFSAACLLSPKTLSVDASGRLTLKLAGKDTEIIKITKQ